MSLPARHWRVLVREQAGTESESTYEQPAGERPPIPGDRPNALDASHDPARRA